MQDNLIQAIEQAIRLLQDAIDGTPEKNSPT